MTTPGEKVFSSSPQVKLAVFLSYMRAVGMFSSIMILLFYTLANACSVGSNFWLSAWSTANTDRPANTTSDNNDTNLYLGVYGALGLAQGECYKIALVFTKNSQVI